MDWLTGGGEGDVRAAERDGAAEESVRAQDAAAGKRRARPAAALPVLGAILVAVSCL